MDLWRSAVLASHSNPGFITVNIEGFNVQVFPNGSCVTTSTNDPIWCHNTVSMKDFLRKNKENIMNISAVSDRLSLLSAIIGHDVSGINKDESVTGVSINIDDKTGVEVDELLISLSNREITVGEFRESLDRIINSIQPADLFLD
jgi:hypothetical protein